MEIHDSKTQEMIANESSRTVENGEKTEPVQSEDEAMESDDEAEVNEDDQEMKEIDKTHEKDSDVKRLKCHLCDSLQMNF